MPIRRQRLIALLILTAVFFAGLLSGVVATRILVQKRFNQAINPHATNPEAIERVARRLERRLDLSPQQQKEIHQVLVDSSARFRSFFQNNRPKVEALVEETRKEIESQLTDDQKKRFREDFQRSRGRILNGRPPPANRPMSPGARRPNTPRLDFDALMQRRDINMDGILATDELPEPFLQRHPGIDADADGIITRAEFQDELSKWRNLSPPPPPGDPPPPHGDDG